MRTTLLITAAALTLTACGGEDVADRPLADGDPLATNVGEDTVEMAKRATPMAAVAAIPALPPVTEAMIKDRIATLSSDEFMGRAPATEGGLMTRRYLSAQMQAVGLEPVGGAYEQAVPLVELTLDPAQSVMTVSLEDGTERALSYGDEAVWWTKQVQETVSFDDSEMVFVGFGIDAPEYGWNDYDGIDVTGKTVVMLVNDPGFYAQGEDFGGRAMTYYGRWTYKFEEAARQGAAAAIIVHETDPAAYGWGVVEGSWTGPQLDLELADGGESRAMAEAWIQRDVAEELFEAAGLSFEDAKAQALAGATNTPMGALTASARLTNTINRSESANVVGMIEGDERPDEVVLYMAHWDHLGSTLNKDGEDHIANGAVDNATGTAGLLAIAETFMAADEAPDRSIMFLAVTAEESGLLGSAYYAEDPLVPFAKTVAGINMDAIQPTGPSRDIVVVGYGASELEDVLAEVGKGRGKTLTPDPAPQNGYFYRSDHISLAKKGVPMLYADKGEDLIDGGLEAGSAAANDYTVNRYHKVTDEYDPETFRLDGIAETLDILRDTGAALAYTDAMPNWYKGNEFRAARDAHLETGQD